MRKDLPIGTIAAQLVHAAGESALFKIPEGTHAVVLSVPNEDELLSLEQLLLDNSIPHRAIRESDSPWNGQIMAIGLIPSRKTEKIKKVLSRFPLLK